MTPKQLGKLGLSLVRSPINTVRALYPTQAASAVDLTEWVRQGADWLLCAQANAPDGDGYSRRYSLISGWDRCYIETTGYIIPTLLDVADFLGNEKYRASAMRAGDWLLSVQTEDGAFSEIDTYRPLVFDTGQVLLGLNRLFVETGAEQYRTAAQKAAQWLVDVQEADGSWVRFAYNDRPHAYYSRVGAALIETGLLLEEKAFVAAGQRNLEWTLRQEQDNGYFQYSEFLPGEDALLHTIVYVLEGFSMAFDLTADQRWAEVTIRGATQLQGRINADGLLYSQYDPFWKATNREYCITGLAQYAGICFDVHRLTSQDVFQKTGEKILEHLHRWQMKKGRNIAGALPSSMPVWGYYGGMAFFNWNNKFFLDAVLKSARIVSDQKRTAT